MTGEDENTVHSVERALDIVEGLKTLETAGVTELADHTGMPPSTVYNYLQTLEGREYVRKDGERYELANRFIHIGDFAKHRLPLYRIGKPNLNWLAETTGKTANLVVEEYGRGIYLLSETNERTLQNYSHVRRREYLHSTAVGKAILMSMTEAEIDEVIEEHGLPALTGETITDRDALLADVETAREQGYAINDEENTTGIRAVGAPIRNPQGSYAAVSVSGHASRYSLEEVHDELADATLDAAKAINVELES